MPEMPDSSPSPPAEPSTAQPSSDLSGPVQATPEQNVPDQAAPDQTDEASVRLLLDALVRRLKSQPQELAKRAVGQEGDEGAMGPLA